MVVSMVLSPKRRSFLEEFTLMGLNFAGIKFCEFLGFSLNSRKSAKLNPVENLEKRYGTLLQFRKI